MRSKQARRARRKCAGMALREARAHGGNAALVAHLFNIGCMPYDEARLKKALLRHENARQHAEAMVKRAR